MAKEMKRAPKRLKSWTNIITLVFATMALAGVIVLAIVFGISPGASKKSLHRSVRGVYMPVHAASVKSVDIGLVRPRFILDGVRLYNNDRILLKNQHNSVENGVYTVGQPLKRSGDMASSDQIVPGNRVHVMDGDENKGQTFSLVVDEQHFELNRTELSFVSEIENIFHESSNEHQVLTSAAHAKNKTRWKDIPSLLNIHTDNESQIGIADTEEIGGLRFQSDYKYTASGMRFPGAVEAPGVVGAATVQGYVPVVLNDGGTEVVRYVYAYSHVPT